eukprot:CAMPEP_0116916838 /NCGR_PEP_ID=MMETSP0467-20121206/18778_1 /TAXON_ID=283647 /ORGANISM="Mesodinium pulex, Strain SPMC105" /LENGTH=190 /DNA_ID=CAMNT_0004593801 /DNA_START=1037 /DNA_END=1609 /DNA_ORIENTATION=-
MDTILLNAIYIVTECKTARVNMSADDIHARMITLDSDIQQICLDMDSKDQQLSNLIDTYNDLSKELQIKENNKIEDGNKINLMDSMNDILKQIDDFKQDFASKERTLELELKIKQQELDYAKEIYSNKRMKVYNERFEKKKLESEINGKGNERKASILERASFQGSIQKLNQPQNGSSILNVSQKEMSKD